MAHELHTRFKAVRAGTSSKRSLAAPAAVARGEAGIRYILRDNAAANVAWSGTPLIKAAQTAGQDKHERRRAIRLAFHPAMKDAAEQGGKTGSRVLDTAIITFPSNWTERARVDAMKRVCALYAPPDSDAIAVAVEHKDKAGNPHFHIASVNGLESAEAAAKRAAENGTRPRRRMANRMGDLGSPKKMRAAIAAEMNAVAAQYRLEPVEHRTLKSRGIDRPAKHASQAAHRAAQKQKPEAEAAPPPPLGIPRHVATCSTRMWPVIP